MILAIAIALVIAALATDRLLLAAESRGWIYYRKRRASPGTSAAAALHMQALLEPDRQHGASVIESPIPDRDEHDEKE